MPMLHESVDGSGQAIVSAHLTNRHGENFDAIAGD